MTVRNLSICLILIVGCQRPQPAPPARDIATTNLTLNAVVARVRDSYLDERIRRGQSLARVIAAEFAQVEIKFSPTGELGPEWRDIDDAKMQKVREFARRFPGNYVYVLTNKVKYGDRFVAGRGGFNYCVLASNPVPDLGLDASDIAWLHEPGHGAFMGILNVATQGHRNKAGNFMRGDVLTGADVHMDLDQAVFFRAWVEKLNGTANGRGRMPDQEWTCEAPAPRRPIGFKLSAKVCCGEACR